VAWLEANSLCDDINPNNSQYQNDYIKCERLWSNPANKSTGKQASKQAEEHTDRQTGTSHQMASQSFAGRQAGRGTYRRTGSPVAEWLACWTQAQKGPVQIAVVTLSGNSLRQTVHTHRASVHQAVKLVAALLRVAGVTAGLAKSNGSLPSGL